MADQKTRKTLERGDFRLLHYAGEVTYSVVGKFHLNSLKTSTVFKTYPYIDLYGFLMSGFLDKNNDLLYRNIKEVRGFTTACILSWPDITEKIMTMK